MNNAAIHLCHTGHAEKSANRWKPGFETDGVGDAVRMAWMRGLLGRGSPSGRPDETCFVPMRVQCCNLYCMPVRRRTGESRDRTAARRHPAAPGGGRDSSARARERRGPTGTRAIAGDRVTRTAADTASRPGTAPVAEPRGRVRESIIVFVNRACLPSIPQRSRQPSRDPRVRARPPPPHTPTIRHATQTPHT